MSKTIRIGIVGLNRGLLHLQAFSQIPASSIVAFADPDPSKRAQASKICPDADAFESANELFATAELDAVVIATPSVQHERQISQAFDLGLHVLAESPVGLTQSEVSHVVTSAGLVGKTFMWSHPDRFDPAIAAAIDAIPAAEESAVYQGVSTVRIAQWDFPTDSWRLDREKGGGALLEVGLPAATTVWFAMGCPEPMEASAASYSTFSQSYATDIEKVAEDCLAGFVRFKDGSHLQINAQIKGNLGDQEEEKALAIWAENTAIDLATGTLRKNGKTRPLPPPSSLDEKVTAQANAFLRCIETGEEPSASGKQALSLSKMVDALLLSAKEKEAQSIKVERSLDDLFGGF